MKSMTGIILKVLIAMSLAQTSVAGPDNDFGFTAPLMRNIEGVWVSESEDMEPVYLHFCKLPRGRVQMGRAYSADEDAELHYVYPMVKGGGLGRNSIHQVVCDHDFGGLVKFEINTFYRKGRRGPVDARMSVRSTNLNEPGEIALSKMKKVFDGRPKSCDRFAQLKETVHWHRFNPAPFACMADFKELDL